MSVLARGALRQLWVDRWQTLMAVLGIAAGVAVVVAVDLGNASSREAMRLAGEQIDGSATHAIVGNDERVDESRYAALRSRWRDGEGPLADARAMAPVVLGDGRLADGSRVRIIGIDVLADAGVRDLPASVQGAGARLLSEPGAVLVSRSVAGRLELDLDDTFGVATGSGRAGRLIVAGLLAGDSRALELIVADIATAQELLAMHGQLSRIDLVLEPPPPRGQLARWAERIFPGLVIGDPVIQTAPLDATLHIESLADRALGTRALAESFRLNLAALGLLALVVGLFLVHGAASYALFRRQRSFGGLRALGVRPVELFRMVQLEALVVALAGVVLGLALGRLLAVGLLSLMSASLAELYDQVAPAVLAPDPVPYLKGGIVGCAGALLVSASTARRVAFATPLQLMQGVALTPWSRISRLGLVSVLAVPAVALLVLDSGYLGALGALGLVLLAYALLVPPLVALLLGAAQRVLRRAPLRLIMLLRESVRGLGRSGVATAALTVAIATAIGMTVMVGSFRSSVEQWLQQRLDADLYFRMSAPPADAEPLRDLLRQGATGWVEQRSWRATVAGRPVVISTQRAFGREPAARAWPMVRGRYAATGIMLSEPLARQLDVGIGERLTLSLAGGPREFEISGVFREYGGGRGRIAIPAALVPRPPRGAVSWAVTTRDPSALERSLAAVVPPDAEFIRQQALLDLSLGIFDRTFRVTRVLQSIAGGVAALGLFAALSGLAIERRRQFGVLRTLGLSRIGPMSTSLGEAGVLGLACGLLAIPAGMLVALILVEVVNPRAFGWTLDFAVRGVDLLQALLVAALAALAGAALPAWRLWRTPVAEMLADARAR